VDGFKITGVVVGPDGTPIANAEVHAFAFDREGASSTTTGADGRFELSAPHDCEIHLLSAPPSR
jgi:hypothetical protein